MRLSTQTCGTTRDEQQKLLLFSQVPRVGGTLRLGCVGTGAVRPGDPQCTDEVCGLAQRKPWRNKDQTSKATFPRLFKLAVSKGRIPVASCADHDENGRPRPEAL